MKNVIINKKISDDCIICAVADTFLETQQHGTTVITPYRMLPHIKSMHEEYELGHDQDAYTCLTGLLAAMATATAHLNRFTGQSTITIATPIYQIFGFTQTTTIKCPKCDRQSVSMQLINHLQFAIRIVDSIEQAFDDYFAATRLHGVNSASVKCWERCSIHWTNYRGCCVSN